MLIKLKNIKIFIAKVLKYMEHLKLEYFQVI